MHRLPANATVPISARSASVIPTEAGALAGQVWSLRDALHGLLLPSGNDIAYALAERISRSVQAFGAVMQAESNALGLSTASNWRDPAGLDSSVAVGGGNWSTARDLARLGSGCARRPGSRAGGGHPAQATGSAEAAGWLNPYPVYAAAYDTVRP